MPHTQNSNQYTQGWSNVAGKVCAAPELFQAVCMDVCIEGDAFVFCVGSVSSPPLLLVREAMTVSASRDGKCCHGPAALVGEEVERLLFVCVCPSAPAISYPPLPHNII